MKKLLVLLCAMAFLFFYGNKQAQSTLILVFDHNTDNQYAQLALDGLGLGYVVGNDTSFNSLLTGSVWDLVVVDSPSNEPTDATGGWSPLINHINGGGSVVMSSPHGFRELDLMLAFDMSGLGSPFYAPQDVFAWETTHPVFNSPNTVSSLSNWTDNWTQNGDRLTVNASSGAIALGGFVTTPAIGEAAIVLGNEGRTIYNGFLFDDANAPAGVSLIQNEITYVLNMPDPDPDPGPAPVPEPATILLLGSGLVGLVRFRRKVQKG